MRTTPAIAGYGALQLFSAAWLFPAWWYGEATRSLITNLRRAFTADRRFLQVRLLLRHQFSALFGGDGSWEMHIISVFLRIPLTICVLVWTAGLAAGLVAVFLLWLALPLIVLSALLFQLGVLPTSALHLLA